MSSRKGPASVSLLCSIFGWEQPGEVWPQHNTVVDFKTAAGVAVGALRGWWEWGWVVFVLLGKLFHI